MSTRISTEDRHAIEDLFARYSWALDTGDPEALAATFAPDGKCIEQVFEEPDIWEGREGVAAMGRHYMSSPNFPGRQHHLTMPLYEMVGPDLCKAKSFVFVTETHGEPPMVLRFSGHYEDEIVRRDGEWLFLNRLIRMWDGEVLQNFPGKGGVATRKRPDDLIVKRD
ncbi:nuclear transport factor 2 family protein [Aurantiacibacter xanthus]|uniref:Nuclear transport factor 2 family protein n=1 Tax=Aurantiacibacter xanthus TaxID=1784712 RepID=A0A3A1NY73_9SPHN|nr:nuclear transport factor 2 family protein [Aurantiacibacter xanthus]RIV80078.1 nuclear transport factor 2 family protein [Aurantiacibacter xanthus]